MKYSEVESSNAMVEYSRVKQNQEETWLSVVE